MKRCSKKTIFALLLLLFSSAVFSQTEKKIFYDEKWQVVDSANASYYRLVTFSAPHRSVGMVRDFYITGEKQWEGYMSYIDDKDNTKDTAEGKGIWYYKNGQKSTESEKLHDVENGHVTRWYENGVKKEEYNAIDGKKDGEYVEYYKNGKRALVAQFVKGELKDDWYTECDEFDRCQRVFVESFSDNSRKWFTERDESHAAGVVDKKGYYMDLKDKSGLGVWHYLPLDVTKNFSIEVQAGYIKGDKEQSFGMLWGFKDWENYSYFVINANGMARIGSRVDGIFVPLVHRKVNSIHKGALMNTLKMNRVNDHILFSVNGIMVSEETYIPIRGNNIGLKGDGGPSQMVFTKLIVREDIGENDAANVFSPNEDWKGNGTGFFIDPRGYIATNYHVVQLASDLQVNLIKDGQKKSYKAKVITSDKQNDLAVIKIEDTAFHAYDSLPYNFKEQLCDVGSNIFVLGYPYGIGGMGEEVKFTDGKISAKTGYLGNITTYQISAPVQPGNSGGPLFDYDGNIIGVVNSKMTGAESATYAIKANYLKSLLEVMPESLNIPKGKGCEGKSLTEKIKILSDYVVMIKIK